MNMYSPKTYRSKLYRDFRAIEPGAWRNLIRFYEQNEAAIRGLDFDEYFDLLLAYTDALFEIGAWQKHLLMADVVIEISVMENLPEFNGREVFKHTLFRKAASHYNLLELEKTDHILRELLRISPNDADCANFLKKCLRSKRPGLIRHARAAAILLFLLSALIILLEMLAVRSFYPQYSRQIEIIRIAIFLSGLLVLGGGEWLHRWRCKCSVEDFIHESKEKKAGR